MDRMMALAIPTIGRVVSDLDPNIIMPGIEPFVEYLRLAVILRHQGLWRIPVIGISEG